MFANDEINFKDAYYLLDNIFREELSDRFTLRQCETFYNTEESIFIKQTCNSGFSYLYIIVVIITESFFLRVGC